MSFLDRNTFAVWGLARSGVAVANLLAHRGKRVIASDIASAESLAGSIEALHPKVEVVTGKNAWEGAEVVVVSPGLRPALPIFGELPPHMPVVSEIEIAREASAHRWVTITGTDGKTTTTELTTHLLHELGCEAVSAGNIGTPLSEIVDVSPDTIVVAEISAFQLWSTHRFSSAAGAITNIADDHLDYFEKNFEAYAAAKLKLLGNNQSQTEAVLNRDDARIARFAAGYPGPVKTFGTTGELKPGDLTFDGNAIRQSGQNIIRWSKSPLFGRHNAMNVMAAVGLVQALGIDTQKAEAALQTFEPLPHRIERVREHQGVVWVNDSKATNAHAAMAGLEAVGGPLVVIAGGVDKNLDLAPFSAYLASRDARVVLIGDITGRLSAALVDAGLKYPAQPADSLEAAVGLAKKAATPGGTVVLSPACSSFDMFDSYADRGNQFRDLVNAL